MTMKIPPLGPPGSPTGVNSYGAWHTVKLGGDTLPGEWRVVGGAIRLKIDRKKKPGADGGNPTLQGLDPQGFELEGRQYTDDERQALANLYARIVPRPTTNRDRNQHATRSQAQRGFVDRAPLLLSNPAVMHFGFSINVMVMGASTLQVVKPGVTSSKLFLEHWLPPAPGAIATVTPKRAYGNNRIAADVNKNNPPPSEQANVCAPPANFTPAQ